MVAIGCIWMKITIGCNGGSEDFQPAGILVQD